jgi:hypothetical protein
MICRKKILSLCPIRAGIKKFNSWGVRTALLKPMNFYFTAMREIKLTQGQVALVDDEDYDYLMQWKWRVRKQGNNFYARTYTPMVDWHRKELAMHRIIMNTPPTLEVDHIDHNGLNNQKSNLRNCTEKQNKQNKKSFGLTSIYLGVSFNKNAKKFQAMIKIDGKGIYGGSWDDEEDAAKSYDVLARQYFGEFANLNFKDSE